MGVDRAALFRLATSERLERAVKRVPGGEAAAWRAASRYVAGRSSRGRRSALPCELLERGARRQRRLVRRAGSATPPLLIACADDYLEPRRRALPPPPARRLAGGRPLPSRRWPSDASGACGDRLAVIARALARRAPQCRSALRRHALDRRGARHASSTWPGLAWPIALGATVQANLRALARGCRTCWRTAGVHIRLVKGAYVEPPTERLPLWRADRRRLLAAGVSASPTRGTPWLHGHA